MKNYLKYLKRSIWIFPLILSPFVLLISMDAGIIIMLFVIPWIFLGSLHYYIYSFKPSDESYSSPMNIRIYDNVKIKVIDKFIFLQNTLYLISELCDIVVREGEIIVVPFDKIVFIKKFSRPFKITDSGFWLEFSDVRKPELKYNVCEIVFNGDNTHVLLETSKESKKRKIEFIFQINLKDAFELANLLKH